MSGEAGRPPEGVAAGWDGTVEGRVVPDPGAVGASEGCSDAEAGAGTAAGAEGMAGPTEVAEEAAGVAGAAGASAGEAGPADG